MNRTGSVIYIYIYIDQLNLCRERVDLHAHAGETEQQVHPFLSEEMIA